MALGELEWTEERVDKFIMHFKKRLYICLYSKKPRECGKIKIFFLDDIVTALAIIVARLLAQLSRPLAKLSRLLAQLL